MKIKKILAFMLAVLMIVPAINLKIMAETDYITVYYMESDANLETAYGSYDTDVVTLIITGGGKLTKEDCDFITQNLNVLSLNLTDSVFKDNKVPEEAFKNYNNLRSVALPLSTAAIGDSAFEGCLGLFNIALNWSLQEIGDSAFASCINLETVTLPANINKIGANAFANSGLTEIIAMRNNGSGYNAALSAFFGVNAKLVAPVGSAGYDSPPFSDMNKTDWSFYKLPSNVYAAAGTTVELSAEVTDKNNNKAAYHGFSTAEKSKGRQAIRL